MSSGAPCLRSEPDWCGVVWQLYMLVLIPALFDLIGTALAKVGLLYTTVSVYQVRGPRGTQATHTHSTA